VVRGGWSAWVDQGSAEVVRVWLKGLTPREREIALLVERNLSNDEIARRLGIKLGTVAIHIHNILIKGGLRRPRSSRGAKTAAGIERIRAAQRRRWQRWRAARSAGDT
jgi:DNA-binding NarL/FixJ family response regulator